VTYTMTLKDEVTHRSSKIFKRGSNGESDRDNDNDTKKK
jgi:hypothetical protein